MLSSAFNNVGRSCRLSFARFGNPRWWAGEVLEGGMGSDLREWSLRA